MNRVEGGIHGYMIALLTIFRRETMRVLRIWWQGLLPPPAMAALYLLIFGEVIGNKIGLIDGHRYVDYMAPGLVLMAVMMSSYSNVSWSFFNAKSNGYIEEIIAAPVPCWLIVLGYVGGGVVRGVIVGATVTMVTLFFSPSPFFSPTIALTSLLLTSIVFSLAGLLNALVAKTFDHISIVPALATEPLIYLGGVFFSVQVLPVWAATLCRMNPVFYMINAFRYGAMGSSDSSLEAAYTVIATLALSLFILSIVLLSRGVGIKS